MTLPVYLELAESRAQALAALLAIGWLVGEFLARGPFTRLLGTLTRLTARLGHKLDRENRGIARRLYRGIVAVGMLLIPAIALSALLAQHQPWRQLLVALLFIAGFGHACATYSFLGMLRRARAGKLPLEMPGLDYLFADSHGVIRALIAARFQAFAMGIVGLSFWYVAAGLIGAGIYLTLAAAHTAYRERLAFGWAARTLFALMHAPPLLVARSLLFVGALLTPGCKPFAGLAERAWLASVASTLGLSLGGPGPLGDQPWLGNGTARAEASHLGRAMHLWFASAVLLVLLLAHQEAYKILIFIFI